MTTAFPNSPRLIESGLVLLGAANCVVDRRNSLSSEPAVAESACTVCAAVQTAGSDILFGKDRYDAKSDRCRHLPMHQLPMLPSNVWRTLSGKGMGK